VPRLRMYVPLSIYMSSHIYLVKHGDNFTFSSIIL